MSAAQHTPVFRVWPDRAGQGADKRTGPRVVPYRAIIFRRSFWLERQLELPL